MPELMFFRGGVEALRVSLEHRRMVLGRAEPCDVVIPDPRVSRQQVALHFDGSRCLLEDLSGQGTRVDGELMSQGELRDGAILELGPWRAMFRLHGSSRDAGPTQPGAGTEAQPRDARQEGLAPAQVRVRQGTTELLHELSEDTLTIGKAADNALVLQDRFISSYHLRVTRRPTGFLVRDLGSTNGTFFKGARLIEAELPLNSVLRVGETELVLEPVDSWAQRPEHGLIGNEPAVRQLVELLQRVAPSNALVTILGESGTGKELVAQALHEGSPRASRPFLTLNCAALAPELIESELFGHEKGAFTGADSKRKGAFEAAQGGTLFLDEVGELPLALQAKLLRVLESGEVKPVGASHPFHVDVRVVAATNRDLLAEVREGRFRKDLYYRLSVLLLKLPPLRERRGDIRLLAEYFVRVHTPQGCEVKLTPAALAKLQEHTWPGNVRELRNVVYRALLLRKGPTLDAGTITFEQTPESQVESLEGLPPELPEGVTLEQMMDRVERRYVEKMLLRCNHHKDKAAKRLGLGRTSLFERMKKWGLGQQHESAR
jgi:two-component system response regulator HydG